jgi:hypothetical protein
MAILGDVHPVNTGGKIRKTPVKRVRKRRKEM